MSGANGELARAQCNCEAAPGGELGSSTLSVRNREARRERRLATAERTAARKDADMYARTVVMQGTPETAEQARKIFADSVMPAAKQQKGFSGALFLSDPNTGKGMSITLWETEADLKAGEGSGYLKEQIAKFGPLLVGPPTREVFVVAVKE